MLGARFRPRQRPRGRLAGTAAVWLGLAAVAVAGENLLEDSLPPEVRLPATAEAPQPGPPPAEGGARPEDEDAADEPGADGAAEAGGETPGRPRNEAESIAYAAWLLVDDPAAALAQYDRFLERFPDSPRRPAARLGRARCLLALGRLKEAFRAAEESFPEETPRPAQLRARCELELEIGRRLALRGRQAEAEPAEKNGAALQAASRVFEAILYNDPQGPYVPEVLFELGNVELARGRIARARKAFVEIVYRHGSSRWVDAARIRGARCLLLEQEAQTRDERLDEAVRLLQGVHRPPLPVVGCDLRVELARVQELLRETQAAAELAKAEFYLKRGTERARRAAVFLLQGLCRSHAATEAARSARERLTALGESVPEPESTEGETTDHVEAATDADE
jgi:tetratricopeptide (TPR) repeat protein